eukprot:TRINITY_DN15680_c0_g1_i2.p1 TRINITY_DN15680_c0_g1~~TRINITY_DN15680_c0_g1_i2.p1  ORF type:complete len:119 (+),score=15.04 TRINITY_DN15680_c0_g1_i2:49-405(+)
MCIRDRTTRLVKELNDSQPIFTSCMKTKECKKRPINSKEGEASHGHHLVRPYISIGVQTELLDYKKQSVNEESIQLSSTKVQAEFDNASPVVEMEDEFDDIRNKGGDWIRSEERFEKV